jgi:hypothetical protein
LLDNQNRSQENKKPPLLRDGKACLACIGYEKRFCCSILIRYIPEQASHLPFADDAKITFTTRRIERRTRKFNLAIESTSSYFVNPGDLGFSKSRLSFCGIRSIGSAGNLNQPRTALLPA